MARRSRYDDFFPFPPSRPRPVQGGIRLQSQRGAVGRHWWARRWVAVLESLGLGARLSRGRSYARQGQVLAIDIARGTVTARVQGSRPQPYQVIIRMRGLTRSQWKRVGRVLSQRAVFAAELLSGGMPDDIEDAFREAGLSLLPSSAGDLETDCSCPDWSNPCKHIAAVYYLLGEEFDRDPFLIFTLRGVGREELVALLGLSEADATTGVAASTPSTPEAADVLPEPLLADPQAFWGDADASQEDIGAEVVIPPVAASLARGLGSFPFWRGEEGFLPVLEATYWRASPVGQEVYLGSHRPRDLRRGGMTKRRSAASAPSAPSGSLQ